MPKSAASTRLLHLTNGLGWAEPGIPAVAGCLLVLAVRGTLHLHALGAGDHDHSIALGIGIYVLFLFALVVNNHVYARGLTVPVLLASVMSLLHGKGALTLRCVARPRSLQGAVS